MTEQSGIQDTGYPALDSTVNFLRTVQFSELAAIEQAIPRIHAAFLKALKDEQAANPKKKPAIA